MQNTVCFRSYPAPGFDKKEILRYAGVKNCDGTLDSLIEECIAEARGNLVYKVCYGEFPVTVGEGVLSLSFAETESEDLRKNLDGCSEIVLFAATVGIGIDRLITKYQKLSPVKALIFQAIGAERIESLCNVFNAEISESKKPLKTRPRFSPGYGDLPIELQKDIFAVLDCPKRLGLTLNGSLLMTPSKSVTAIIGVGGASCGETDGSCKACGNKDCGFRREV